MPVHHEPAGPLANQLVSDLPALLTRAGQLSAAVRDGKLSPAAGAAAISSLVVYDDVGNLCRLHPDGDLVGGTLTHTDLFGVEVASRPVVFPSVTAAGTATAHPERDPEPVPAWRRWVVLAVVATFALAVCAAVAAFFFAGSAA